MMKASETLARKFAAILADWLGKDLLNAVNERNDADPDKSTCATHDYCDSNQAMIDAMAALGIEYILSDDTNDKAVGAQTDLVNTAWNTARANKFWVDELPDDDKHKRPYLLIEDDKAGCLADGRDTMTVDKFRDLCGFTFEDGGDSVLNMTNGERKTLDYGDNNEYKIKVTYIKPFGYVSEEVADLKKAIRAFARAAVHLERMYLRVDGDTCSKAYPFERSFDEIARDIQIWANEN